VQARADQGRLVDLFGLLQVGHYGLSATTICPDLRGRVHQVGVHQLPPVGVWVGEPQVGVLPVGVQVGELQVGDLPVGVQVGEPQVGVPPVGVGVVHYMRPLGVRVGVGVLVGVGVVAAAGAADAS
jgi:hypothetical protein